MGALDDYFASWQPSQPAATPQRASPLDDYFSSWLSATTPPDPTEGLRAPTPIAPRLPSGPEGLSAFNAPTSVFGAIGQSAQELALLPKRSAELAASQAGQGLAGAGRALADMTGWDALGRESQRYGQFQQEVQKEIDPGLVEQIGATAFQLPVAAMPGGLAMLAGQAAGAEYGQAREQNATPAQAAISAGVTGGAEYLGERYLGAVPLLRRMQEAATAAVVRPVRGLLAGAGLEGSEELVSFVAQRIGQEATYSDKYSSANPLQWTPQDVAQFQADVAEAAQNFAVGAGAGGMFMGASIQAGQQARRDRTDAQRAAYVDRLNEGVARDEAILNARLREQAIRELAEPSLAIADQAEAKLMEPFNELRDQSLAVMDEAGDKLRRRQQGADEIVGDLRRGLGDEAPSVAARLEMLEQGVGIPEDAAAQAAEAERIDQLLLAQQSLDLADEATARYLADIGDLQGRSLAIADEAGAKLRLRGEDVQLGLERAMAQAGVESPDAVGRLRRVAADAGIDLDKLRDTEAPPEPPTTPGGEPAPPPSPLEQFFEQEPARREGRVLPFREEPAAEEPAAEEPARVPYQQSAGFPHKSGYKPVFEWAKSLAYDQDATTGEVTAVDPDGRLVLGSDGEPLIAKFDHIERDPETLAREFAMAVGRDAYNARKAPKPKAVPRPAPVVDESLIRDLEARRAQLAGEQVEADADETVIDDGTSAIAQARQRVAKAEKRVAKAKGRLTRTDAQKALKRAKRELADLEGKVRAVDEDIARARAGKAPRVRKGNTTSMADRAMNARGKQEEAAYNEGVEAARSNKPATENPYNPQSGLSEIWFDGYDEAKASFSDDAEAFGVVAKSPLDRLLDRVLARRGRKGRSDGAAFLDDEVERRWSENKGIQAKGILARTKDALRAVKESATRYYPQLNPKVREHSVANDILRRHRAAEGNAALRAFHDVDRVTRELTAEQGDLLTRVVATRDILRSIDEGLYEGKEIPFGFTTRGHVEQEIERMESLVSDKSNAAVRKALEIRNREVVRPVVQELVKEGLLGEKALHNVEAYFHRQVMSKQQELSHSGSSTIRVDKKGFQRTRVGGGDFNTSYQQAEYEWLRDAYALLAKKRTLRELEADLDISGELKARAKSELGDAKKWRSLVPDTHTIWQPERGNHFFPALSVTEATLDKVLSGQRALRQEDVREILALGPRKKEWALPSEVVEVLERELVEDRETAVGRIASKGEGLWKQAVLFGPFRALRYNVRNQVSDTDFFIGLDPKALRGWSKWANRLWKYHISRTSSPELTKYILELADLGVLDSGFSREEVADLNRLGLLKTMGETDKSLKSRAMAQFDTVKGLTTLRENILRATSYERALELVSKSRKEGRRIYWASKAEEVDALYDSGKSSKKIAAKLAREAAGDYGDRSKLGRWMRKRIQPFWSWSELNAGRYANLFRNAAREGRSIPGVTAKVAAGVAVKGGAALARRSLQVTALYALATIWNRLQFPEEDELLNRGRREYHLILGRTEDGEIRSLAVSGSLADLLSWVALEDVAGTIADVAAGRRTKADVAADAVKGPFERLAQGWEPYTKTAGELISGKTAYPQVFERGASLDLQPRTIQNRGQHAAGVVGLRPLYDAMAHIPQKGRTTLERFKRAASPFTYTNEGEQGFWMAREMAYRFLDNKGLSAPAGMEKNDKQLALYYLKRAKQYGDTRNEKYWKEQYDKLRGDSRDGTAQSVRASSPIGPIPKKLRAEFWKSLNSEDRKLFSRGLSWYAKTMGASEAGL